MYLINPKTQETFECLVQLLIKNDYPMLNSVKYHWGFDWKKEAKRNTVYKLTLINNTTIHGLISVRYEKDYIFMPLVETAIFNRGKNKVYDRVLLNLVAFVIQLSFNTGREGYVSFTAKSSLVEHYKKQLGAVQIGHSNKMFIDTIHAQKLLSLVYESD